MGLLSMCGILVGFGSVSYCVRWYYIGRLYESRRKFEKEELIVVTGATSGIGLATVTELVDRGCHLVIGCRSLVAGCAIRDQLLLLRNPAARVEVFELRLESLASVVEFSESVRLLGKPIYALINNAAVFYVPPKRTENGHEYTYQVNYLAPYLLTLRLLPLLKQREGESRIVNVVSQAHRAIAEARVDESSILTPSNDTVSTRFCAYQYSKLCLVAFSHQLALLLSTGQGPLSSGVSVHCIDPGNVETPIYRHFPPLANPVLYYLQKPLRFFLIKTPREGAQGILYCVLSEQKPPFYVRRFWKTDQSDSSDINPLIYQPTTGQAIWKRSRQQCNDFLLEMSV
ncbi:retinol dehydrogenase 12-like [Anopheles darlingi]|uniref:retinol dehydrogenase 12-like n=1 Tax=Anopheles darlingi TaxID=43151 RepID=UPI0021005D55|nr:retinol dehydrogenase 12-like [Anopheles darlingi]